MGRAGVDESVTPLLPPPFSRLPPPAAGQRAGDCFDVSPCLVCSTHAPAREPAVHVVGGLAACRTECHVRARRARRTRRHGTRLPARAGGRPHRKMGRGSRGSRRGRGPWLPPSSWPVARRHDAGKRRRRGPTAPSRLRARQQHQAPVPVLGKANEAVAAAEGRGARGEDQALPPPPFRKLSRLPRPWPAPSLSYAHLMQAACHAVACSAMPGHPQRHTWQCLGLDSARPWQVASTSTRPCHPRRDMLHRAELLF